jgi:glutamate racemase
MGGLTVLRALEHALAHEHFVYLGDTARLPYGTKSAATVGRYACQAAEVLVGRGVKALVIACNTASSVALDELTRAFAPLPVFGVVRPGALAVLDAPHGASILVLATESTVAGGAYARAIVELRPDLKVWSRACPLLVALAEEGRYEGAVVELVLRDYLGPASSGFHTVLLGCTHFPIFAPAIARLVPASRVVDSAATTAARVRDVLGSRASSVRPASTFLATDGVDRFRRVGRYFLGRTPEHVELVDL